MDFKPKGIFDYQNEREPINLSILDFKLFECSSTIDLAIPINLSILDFKQVIQKWQYRRGSSINLSILDFKQ